MEMVFLFLRVTRSAKFRFLKERAWSLDVDIYFLCLYPIRRNGMHCTLLCRVSTSQLFHHEQESVMVVGYSKSRAQHSHAVPNFSLSLWALIKIDLQRQPTADVRLPFRSSELKCEGSEMKHGLSAWELSPRPQPCGLLMCWLRFSAVWTRLRWWLGWCYVWFVDGGVGLGCYEGGMGLVDDVCVRVL
jgi:hypothetical protein